MLFSKRLYDDLVGETSIASINFQLNAPEHKVENPLTLDVGDLIIFFLNFS